MNILFALAIAMAVGMAMTRLIRLIHLPNVTAYLIAGLLVGPYVLKVLTPEMNSKLSIISDVALGFIAYSIGSEFKFSYIKEIGAKPMVITAFEGCVASLLVFLTLLALLGLFGQPRADGIIQKPPGGAGPGDQQHHQHRFQRRGCFLVPAVPSVAFYLVFLHPSLLLTVMAFTPPANAPAARTAPSP